MLNVETSPDSNIKTAEDALWWSAATVTTVGYGDFYPKTTLGRIIAVMLMISGVGLFGTFTAYTASFFMEKEMKIEEDKTDLILKKLNEISEWQEKHDKQHVHKEES
jgi:voltage-gated potassium channel